MIAAAAVIASGAVAMSAPDVSLLDVVELDMGYTTITDNFYRTVAPQRLLDGARTGIVAYLRSRGVTDAHIPVMRARSDGRGVVPAIEQQIGRAIERYGTRVDARGLVYGAIRGELAALDDPYSVFFTKTELSRFTSFLDGASFGGVGIVLARDADGRYHADDVFASSPAARAGIVAGDRIVAVDGTPADGAPPATMSALLRGRSGTTVRITVMRGGGDTARELTLTRAAITPPDVSSRMLPSDVAYVALRAFGPDAGAQVRAALTRLRAQGARAEILDLRGNGGGYESSAVHVASTFVPRGTIVATQTQHGRRIDTPADGSAPAPLPLVILVDHDSASGSELVAAAIVDHGLARVVGARTFGKGVVQTMFPLPDGSAMKVTTARYFTPNGRDIDRVGITPDVIVEQPADAPRGVPGGDPQLDAALALLTPAAPRTAPAPPATHR